MPAPNVDEVQVPCSLFLGLNTEVSPPDLPEGVSPDCQDVAFVPGNVSSRPCLHGIFGTPFPGNPTVSYMKTFGQPDEDPLNLYMTSDGNVYFEDVLSSPNTYTLLDQVIAQLYAQSVTASGAEYIAFSDGLHGMDIPRQVYRTPDGTLQFDRVSQDGPGSGPTIINFAPPPATIANPASPSTVTIAGGPTGIVFGGLVTNTVPGVGFEPPFTVSYYTTCTITTTTPHGFSVGASVTITGSTSTPSVNNTYPITNVPSPTTFTFRVVAIVPVTNGGGGQATSTASNTSMARLSNTVTVGTSAPHNFKIGWQVQVSGVTNTAIGGGITVIARDATGLVTVTTATPHGLPENATIQIAGVTNPDTTFNGVFPVNTVPSPTTFTYLLPGTVATSSAGSGNVQDIWNFTAFIQSTPTPTTFTYQQVGPDDTTGNSGTATIIGQVSPGIHQCVVMFQTRSGYVTAPCPPISFSADGQQQLSLSNIPIGPPNVVARLLAFTGAGGANYFYLPVTPTVGTQVVGNSTVINDNTSTTAIIDFADTTLFGGLAIDIPGNDLFNQIVLAPCLGFFYYASRLFAWGMANKVEGFLNMGFDGGYYELDSQGIINTPFTPTGWQFVIDAGATAEGSLNPGGAWDGGMTWETSSQQTVGATHQGLLQQSAFQDAFGVAILQPDTQYFARLWAKPAASTFGGSIAVDFYSASLGGVISTGAFGLNGLSTAGEFLTVSMDNPTPSVIPPDLLLRVWVSPAPAGQTGGLVEIDEVEIIPTFEPYFPQFLVSYVDNFEAFDGVTGVLGPTADPNPLRGCETLRDQLQFLTSGGMHQTSDNGQEPSSWTVSEISNDVGLVASRAIDTGEECIVFVSKSGGGNGAQPTYALRIYEGGQPWKISQEVQSIFDDINPAAEQSMWLVNDIGQRRIYVGVPTGNATAPNVIYPLDYREIDTAAQIASAASIHISFTGKMIASDLARKWTIWNIQANCGAMLARSAQDIEFCVGAGNGLTPGLEAGSGNVYFLDPNKFTDDYYGVVSPYYTMYFFISRDNETALGVGSMRKLYKRVSEFITGIGQVQITPYAASLTNPWPGPPIFTLGSDAIEDHYHGLNVSTERMAIKFSASPLSGQTDVQFTLQHMEATIMQHPVSPFGTGANL